MTWTTGRLRGHIYAGLYITVLTAFLSSWDWKTAGHLSLSAIATFAAFSWMALAYGDFFLWISPLSSKLARACTFRFLFGYFIVNTCIAILSLTTPIGVAGAFLILAAGAIILFFVRHDTLEWDPKSTIFVPDLLCALVGATAATLWCADALTPTVVDGQSTIFRVWQDSFNHVRMIAMFSQAHGIGSLSDVRMAGAPPVFYHYASYFLPAAIVSLTGASAFDVFVGFQLPFGILLTALAAFALAGSLWGFWPGLAATCALILFPDAYQQGFGNRLLSYNFLQQVNLAGLYGVSCAAAAWIFILNGCRDGKYWSIIFGYAFILLTLIYKSQIFVANAFLAMMYPCVFLHGLSARLRWLSAILFLAVFIVVVRLSQHVDGAPTLRLDFSSTSDYAAIILEGYDLGGFLRGFVGSHILHGRLKILAGVYFAGVILLSSFGLWNFACSAVFLRLRTTLHPAILFFPLLLVANYLVMAMGLAMNARAMIGTPEELLNRPVVWAYFGVVVWTAGAFYAFAFGDRPPEEVRTRALIAVFALLCLAVPWHFARNLQTFPAWPSYGSFKEFARFPSCLVNAARYLKEHSRIVDVIQDSTNDRNLLVGALAERQDFAVDWMFRTDLKDLKDRLDELASFRVMTSETDLNAFAVRHKIAWYLLRPETKVSWSKEFVQTFVFDCNGYRVYRFASGS